MASYKWLARPICGLCQFIESLKFGLQSGFRQTQTEWLATMTLIDFGPRLGSWNQKATHLYCISLWDGKPDLLRLWGPCRPVCGSCEIFGLVENWWCWCHHIFYARRMSMRARKRLLCWLVLPRFRLCSSFLCFFRLSTRPFPTWRRTLLVAVGQSEQWGTDQANRQRNSKVYHWNSAVFLAIAPQSMASVKQYDWIFWWKLFEEAFRNSGRSLVLPRGQGLATGGGDSCAVHRGDFQQLGHPWPIT